MFHEYAHYFIAPREYPFIARDSCPYSGVTSEFSSSNQVLQFQHAMT